MLRISKNTIIFYTCLHRTLWWCWYWFHFINQPPKNKVVVKFDDISEPFQFAQDDWTKKDEKKSGFEDKVRKKYSTILKKDSSHHDALWNFGQVYF